MSRKFFTDIDLNTNELKNAVVHALNAAPVSGSEGQIYFNTTDNTLYQYYNSSWNVVGKSYSLTYGTLSSNKIPIYLYSNGSIQDTINIEGAGGATLTYSNSTLTITTSDNNTTYNFSGSDEGTEYEITITPSTGSETIISIPYLTASNSGTDLSLVTTGEKYEWNNKVSGNGRLFYGTCDTGASVATKNVSCANYDTLTAGDILVVTFANTNTNSNPSLNVNSTRNIGIRQYYNGDLDFFKQANNLSGTCIFVFYAFPPPNYGVWILLNVDTDTINNGVEIYRVWAEIRDGSTSITADVNYMQGPFRIVSYCAYIEDEEVIVDYSYNYNDGNMTATWSVELLDHPTIIIDVWYTHDDVF